MNAEFWLNLALAVLAVLLAIYAVAGELRYAHYRQKYKKENPHER